MASFLSGISKYEKLERLRDRLGKKLIKQGTTPAPPTAIAQNKGVLPSQLVDKLNFFLQLSMSDNT